MAFGACEGVLGAEVDVVVFDMVVAVFLNVGHGPARWDLLPLVAVWQPYFAAVVAAYPVSDFMEQEGAWHVV